MDVLAFFNWLDTSWLASISKAYGGVFAVVQMVHLLSLALLGGCVILADLRLMGWLLTDVDLQTVHENTRKGFTAALIAIALSGVFMSSAVAMRLYYNEMFWAKMTGLLVGVVFYYALRQPLIRSGDSLSAATRYTIAAASLLTWFTVAASGRWIGFS